MGLFDSLTLGIGPMVVQAAKGVLSVVDSLTLETWRNVSKLTSAVLKTVGKEEAAQYEAFFRTSETVRVESERGKSIYEASRITDPRKDKEKESVMRAGKTINNAFEAGLILMDKLASKDPMTVEEAQMAQDVLKRLTALIKLTPKLSLDQSGNPTLGSKGDLYDQYAYNSGEIRDHYNPPPASDRILGFLQYYGIDAQKLIINIEMNLDPKKYNAKQKAEIAQGLASAQEQETRSIAEEFLGKTDWGTRPLDKAFDLTTADGRRDFHDLVSRIRATNEVFAEYIPVEANATKQLQYFQGKTPERAIIFGEFHEAIHSQNPDLALRCILMAIREKAPTKMLDSMTQTIQQSFDCSDSRAVSETAHKMGREIKIEAEVIQRVSDMLTRASQLN